MEKNKSSPDEINSKKKRKLQEPPVETPLRKHVCWGQNINPNNPSPDSPKKEQSESDPESVKDSNSIHCNNDDSMMSTDEDEANTTDLEYLEISTSDEPSTSSMSWSSMTSSYIGLNSSEDTSLIMSSSEELETLSSSKQFDCVCSQYGSRAECSCLECTNDGIKQCSDFKDLEDLLYSNGAAPDNYVLSSGRWSVNLDTLKEGKKLTIDKEFEQYFATLIL